MKQDAKSYNGWTNYETWVTALWLDNDYATQCFWRETARDCKTSAPCTRQVKHGHWTVEEAARFTLAQRGPDLSLTGIDIDEAMLSIAKRRLPQVRFLQGSIDAVPVDDESADMVISSMVFYHLPRDVKQGAFREAKRILKSEGLFRLCDFATSVNRRGAWLARWFGKLESGVARQAMGELLEIATSESMTMVPRWTRLGCITQHEVRAVA